MHDAIGVREKTDHRSAIHAWFSHGGPPRSGHYPL